MRKCDKVWYTCIVLWNMIEYELYMIKYETDLDSLFNYKREGITRGINVEKFIGKCLSNETTI